MTDPLTVAAAFAVFLVAGGVKGLVGFGLPAVSLALLTLALDLTTAMVLVLVPSLLTNVWQAAAGGNGRAILGRIWPFLAMATATVWLGALALVRVDVAWLSGLLGVLLVTYSALDLGGVRFALSARQEVWAGPMLGAVNGVLTGMTGTFLVPGILFLQAIGMSRDMLVQALGMLFIPVHRGPRHGAVRQRPAARLPRLPFRRRPGSGDHRHGLSGNASANACPRKGFAVYSSSPCCCWARTSSSARGGPWRNRQTTRSDFTEERRKIFIVVIVEPRAPGCHPRVEAGILIW